MPGWTWNERFSFTAPLSTGQDVTHEVYAKGSGAPILILQELPGIGPETLELTDRLVDAGFKVFLPHMFGTFGKVTMMPNLIRLFCIRREFHIFLKGRQSPIAAWMRALTRDIKKRENASGVGVLGMCLTGSFALPLMADEAVLGAVASQPALPTFGGDALHMSDSDISEARAGMRRNGPALAMRYRDDKKASARMMRALEKQFCEDLTTVEFPGNGHSLLTLHFHEPAYQRVEQYFRDRFAQVPENA